MVLLICFFFVCWDFFCPALAGLPFFPAGSESVSEGRFGNTARPSGRSLPPTTKPIVVCFLHFYPQLHPFLLWVSVEWNVWKRVAQVFGGWDGAGFTDSWQTSPKPMDRVFHVSVGNVCPNVRLHLQINLSDSSAFWKSLSKISKRFTSLDWFKCIPRTAQIWKSPLWQPMDRQILDLMPCRGAEGSGWLPGESASLLGMLHWKWSLRGHVCLGIVMVMIDCNESIPGVVCRVRSVRVSLQPFIVKCTVHMSGGNLSSAFPGWKILEISTRLKLWLVCCLSFDSESTTAWAAEIMLMLDCILCALLAWSDCPVHTQLLFAAGVSCLEGLEEQKDNFWDFWMDTGAYQKIRGFSSALIIPTN